MVSDSPTICMASKAESLPLCSLPKPAATTCPKKLSSPRTNSTAACAFFSPKLASTPCIKSSGTKLFFCTASTARTTSAPMTMLMTKKMIAYMVPSAFQVLTSRFSALGAAASWASKSEQRKDATNNIATAGSAIATRDRARRKQDCMASP